MGSEKRNLKRSDFFIKNCCYCQTEIWFAFKKIKIFPCPKCGEMVELTREDLEVWEKIDKEIGA